MNPFVPAYLTSHQIAQLVHVSPSTVLSWIDKGLLEAHRTPGGHRRVERSALVSFLRAHKMPVPRELAGGKLLIIDDDPPFLRTTKRTLKRVAPWLEVETSDGAEEALIRVGTFRADAVILDAVMPNMNGMEVCRILRGKKETRHIVVIAVSARPTPEMELEFLRAGATAFLAKPIDLTQVLQILSSSGLRKEAVL